MKTANICKAFSSEIRVRLVQCLREPKNVSSLRATCLLSQSALSQHLKVLRDTGIVHTTRSGKEIFYQVSEPRYITISNLLLTSHA